MFIKILKSRVENKSDKNGKILLTNIKSSKRRLFWFLLFLGVYAGTGCASVSIGTPAPVNDAAGSLRAMLEKSVNEIGTPGAVLAITRPDGDEIITSTGFAEIKSQIRISGEPAGPEKAVQDFPGLMKEALMTHCAADIKISGVAMHKHARFHIGSVTKSFIAVAVLRLVEEGLMSLDDPVSNWLPELVDNGEAITIRQLLNHTSGLCNYTDHPRFYADLAAAPRKQWKPDDLISYARDMGPCYKTGESWLYSNTNYILLGMVIEKATGRPCREVLKEEVLEPLGLENTYLPEAGSDPRLCRGYRYSFDVRGKWEDYTNFADPSWIWTAGAMVSNAEDLLVWLRELNKGNLISPNLKKEMQSFVQTGVKGEQYGLGLLKWHKAVGHDGDYVFGYQACIFRYKNHDIVILTNGLPAKLGILLGPTKILSDVIRFLFEENWEAPGASPKSSSY